MDEILNDDIKELLKNVNFDLKVLEAVVCLNGIFFIPGDNVYNVMSIHGWLIIALSFILAYYFEDPNKWTEFFLIFMYLILTILAITFSEFSIEITILVILAFLLCFDMFWLLCKKVKCCKGSTKPPANTRKK